MIATNAAFFRSTPDFYPFLPPILCVPDTPETLGSLYWDLLALSRTGCRALLSHRISCSCGTLLLPGDDAASITQLVQANQIISTGLSARNSITFSSLRPEDALVCIQRTLIREDGISLEPQEILRPALPLPAEDQLLVFGLQLLL